MLGTEGELGDVLRAAVLVHHDDVVLPGHTELGGHETSAPKSCIRIASEGS